MKAADLEWFLASQGFVETDMEENPARARGANSIKMRRGKGKGARGGRKGSDDDDDDNDDDGGDY